MVRTFDFEKNDISRQLLNYIYSLNPFSSAKAHLSISQQKTILGKLLETPEYQQLRSELKGLSEKDLQIRFKGNCNDNAVYSKNYKNYDQFQAENNPETQEITICPQLIKSEIDLKRNFDREINLLRYGYPSFYKHGKYLDRGRSDNEFARASYFACRKSLEPYFTKYNQEEKIISKTLLKESTEVCATYLTKNRGPNVDNKPVDIWFRFSRSIVERNRNIFELKDFSELDKIIDLGYQ